jgi:hypothetical protein
LGQAGLSAAWSAANAAGCTASAFAFLGDQSVCDSQTGQTVASNCTGNVLGGSGSFYICIHQSGADWIDFTKKTTTLAVRLNKDSDCMNFLMSAGASLAKLNGVFSDVPTTFSLAANIVDRYGRRVSGTTNDSGVPTAIVINALGLADSYQLRLTVLHEVAHLLNVFPSENGSSGQSHVNDGMIEDHCSKTLGSVN